MQVWENAFKIAIMKGFETIAITAIGYGAFNPYGYKSEKFLRDFHHKIIVQLKDNYPKIQVMEMGEKDVPNVVCEKRLENILWTNAWDPWSIIGNGNSKDNSLDGWWGRSTAIAVLGWPVSNPFIEYKSI
jgi:hypothetical protein